MSPWLSDGRHFLFRFGGRRPVAFLPLAIFAQGPFHNKTDELQSAGQPTSAIGLLVLRMFNGESTILRNAVRVLTSTIGVICGISGLEHGFFEALQGNVTPVIHMVSGKPMIYAIGEANRFWQFGFEYAYTVIPNLLITGILAIIAGLLVVTWSAGFIQKKIGWLVFLLLSTIQYVVGGGAAQFGPAIVVGLVAILINHPLKWPRTLFPKRLRQVLARPWLGLLVVFAFVFCHSIVTAVFGFFYGVKDPNMINQVIWGALYFMIALLPFVIVSALAHDSLETVGPNPGAAK